MITFMYVPIILHQRKLLDRSELCINMHVYFLSRFRRSFYRKLGSAEKGKVLSKKIIFDWQTEPNNEKEKKRTGVQKKKKEI